MSVVAFAVHVTPSGLHATAILSHSVLLLHSARFDGSVHPPAAGLDPLLDEGFAYKKRLEYFGNKVNYKLYPGQIHGFLSNSKHFPKALDCMKDIGMAAKLMVNKNE